ncbi:MAG: hypothetical protein A2504_00415 [Bdellovibrionales bacterium RIFOXYD12_FULL_39_22]|nr:MAG: hypothetical protein A2385_13995 [Bdellovibrionales bacterium RIFOXYB1_FULL_39_21]OFZ42444.1 MAG: hypothetical protein A2485_04045 [Bdellovibrionales bacterium RIFOXYC12_FULL_39_17]OFZ45420.1 MAG: hypothetical protein A2404_01485 [Bdellovibrionales bacterium RIFOXYC1_FULL_39_130]OFZ68420.1 MAG: hypothetical protein A2451_01560 [Bdellovibrionales bacterium RIFOXYC2_FULL_39_8]OFZ74617.1 MAG: hypothetical protein A2560_09515 [Bdellovibrionales bacterium RIFOXYD1_FULL_39_84]OFZ92899.1 MAG:
MENKEQIYLGRLGKNPELQYTMNNKAVCYLAVAINKKGEGDINKTEWMRVVVWGKQAEICPLFLKKGYEVFVHGTARVREFINKAGEKKQYEEISARLIGFPTT